MSKEMSKNPLPIRSEWICHTVPRLFPATAATHCSDINLHRTPSHPAGIIDGVRAVSSQKTSHHPGTFIVLHASLQHVVDDLGFPINRAPLEAHQVRPGSRNTHEQMWLQHFGGAFAAIDIGIASTISALWTAGVDTAFSCEGDANVLRYISVRANHRFVAADVLIRLGERLVDQHGGRQRWVFQLSHHPLR
jgi:hypothetical protein